MGTSAMSVALLAVGEGSSLAGPTQAAARAILVLALVLGVLVLGATATRWVRFTAEARADLRHPVKGGMTATAAGGLLTLAVAIGKVGPGFLPDPVILPTVTVLAVVGALSALLIGWEFLAEVFTSQDAVLAQMSGAWFVPPVVTIIVPLALLPVIAGNPGIAADLVAMSGLPGHGRGALPGRDRRALHAQHQPPAAAGRAGPDAVHRHGPSGPDGPGHGAALPGVGPGRGR